MVRQACSQQSAPIRVPGSAPVGAAPLGGGMIPPATTSPMADASAFDSDAFATAPPDPYNTPPTAGTAPTSASTTPETVALEARAQLASNGRPPSNPRRPDAEPTPSRTSSSERPRKPP